jgi:hypothetical protein
VTVYAAGSAGNASPTITITGSVTPSQVISVEVDVVQTA